jgi:hypothetical protein
MIAFYMYEMKMPLSPQTLLHHLSLQQLDLTDELKNPSP